MGFIFSAGTQTLACGMGLGYQQHGQPMVACWTCDAGRPARTHRRSDTRGGTVLSQWCSGQLGLAALELTRIPSPTPDSLSPELWGVDQQLYVRPSGGGGFPELLTFANHRWTCSHCRGDGDTASNATQWFSRESPLLLCLRVSL